MRLQKWFGPIVINSMDETTSESSRVAFLLASADSLFCATLQAGIEFKKNLRVRIGNYGGLKLEYFWVVKSKKAKSFIRG